MIRFQVTGRHYELDRKIIQYVESKLGRLDRFLPRDCRGNLSGSVILEFDESHTADQRCMCEVNFDVRGEHFVAKEATINMYAAIDICDQKLKHQILAFKSKREPARNRRQRLWGKMMGRDPFTG